MRLRSILNLSVILFMGISIAIILGSVYMLRHSYSRDIYYLHVAAGSTFFTIVLLHVYLRKNRLIKKVSNCYDHIRSAGFKNKIKGKKMFYDEIDFASMYKQHKAATVFKGKGSSDWDKKSKEMAPRMQKSLYVDDFISRMDISTQDTVLDIGCGPGTLAIPLAKKVKHVIAVDFSKDMLGELEHYAKKEGITNITTYHIGWDDDWSELPETDIVLASRSVEVKDIDEALKKMSSHAKRTCYLTYKTGGSFVDMKILDFIDKKIITKPDFWYIPLLLYKQGYMPKIDYITTKDGSVKYGSADEFVSSLIWSIGALDERQQAKAKEYYDLYIKDEKEYINPTIWAFIAWSTTGA